MQKVPSSYKDPSSSVFYDENTHRFFRSLRFAPSIYNSIAAFPQVLESKEGELFEVEAIPFVNYYYEWTFDQFKDSAIYFLEVLKELNTKGYAFSDATPLNITYLGNGNFIFIDHGSLIKKDSEVWPAFYQFLKEYAYPLLYLSEHPSPLPLSLLPIIASKDWMFTYKPTLSNRLSFKYALLKSALTLSAKKSLTDYSEKKQGFSNQYHYNIEFFLDYVKSLNQRNPKRTRWGNYYSDTVLGEEYIQNKKKALLDFFQLISPNVKVGVDLGASDGMMSEYIVKNFPSIKFISVESDLISSKRLYERSKKSNIIPIYNSIYQLSPTLGFSGSIDSLEKRLFHSADVVMGLGLIHHLMHEENLAYKEILRFVFKIVKPNGYVILEYIDVKDPRHKLIYNPSYPYPLNLEQLESDINLYGKVINVVRLTENRVLYLLKNQST